MRRVKVVLALGAEYFWIFMPCHDSGMAVTGPVVVHLSSSVRGKKASNSVPLPRSTPVTLTGITVDLSPALILTLASCLRFGGNCHAGIKAGNHCAAHIVEVESGVPWACLSAEISTSPSVEMLILPEAGLRPKPVSMNSLLSLAYIALTEVGIGGRH